MMVRMILAFAFTLLPALAWAGAMQIESSKMIFYHKKNMAEFTGNVQVRRDGFSMNCDRMVVYYREGESGELDYVDAFGHVSMAQGEKKGFADKARLNQRENTLTLTGNAVLEQPGGRITGETITHHISSEQTEVQPAKGGRTRMIIETGDKADSILPETGKAK